MENSIKNVQDFNKNFANELYSEAYFDKEFIKNPSSNIMSLRLGREKRKIDEEKNNKKWKMIKYIPFRKYKK